MSDIKKKILSKIGQPVLSALATLTGDGKPWVRYVTPIADENLTIRFATHLNSRKVAHIRKNNEVHLTTGVTDPAMAESYLQIQGRAEISTDPELKKRFWMDMFSAYFSGPDDPNYCVCEIRPYRIELQSMKNQLPEVWEE